MKPNSVKEHPSSGQATAGRVAHRRVLVVDDEADLRELLELTLVGMGLDVDCVGTIAEAHEKLSQRTPALCLTDMRLPDGEGLELVEMMGREYPQVPVAVITAYGSAENAVAALKAGAFDYLAKPVALDALRSLVRSALVLPGADGSSPAAVPGIDAGYAERRLPGDSAVMRDVRAQIGRLARSMAPVAIGGESGTGKELAARLIHEASARATQAFVAVNCGAIPESLMEAEFFGYRKGAFTGAEHDRDGFFQAAHGGTLFLDEVADLPLSMQVKLLRVIQEKRVRKLGGTSEEPVDVRIVCATHQDLAHCVATGRFRQDLYYRLNVIELHMPALRDRLEDVPILARSILARLTGSDDAASGPRLAPVALRYLQSYHYPGNVRELENVLERGLAFCDHEVINVEDLGLRPVVSDDSENERNDAGTGRGMDAAGAAASERKPMRMSADGIPESLPDYLEHIEREAIQRALEKTRQNRTAAARLLGITFRALRHRMQRLGLN